MPTAAVLGVLIAPAVSTASVPFTLFVGGDDVGVGTLVDRDSIEVTEAGPGAVSSMVFTVFDPAFAVVIDEGMDVRFWDRAHDTPVFVGWVQSWSYRSTVIGGRYIDVTCIGPEALLDWCVTTYDVTIPINSPLGSAALAIAAAAAATGPLRGSTDEGFCTLEMPTSPLYIGGATQDDPVVIPAGTTLREGLRQVHANATGFLASIGLSGGATVDMFFGLRTFMMNDYGRRPNDYVILTITNTVAGTEATDVGLAHEVDASSVVRGVYVVGGNALGSGLVSDGSGLTGPISVINDSTILTATARNAAALAYLSTFSTGVRGSFTISAYAAVATRISAGGYVDITDAGTQLTTNKMQIGSIRKTFQATTQTWTVTYGGQEASAMRQVRRLTKDSNA